MTLFYITAIFAVASMISAAVAFAGGAHSWRFQPRGMRIILALVGIGLCIDGFTTYCIATSQKIPLYWSALDHPLQFFLVILALLDLSREVLLERMYRLLVGSLVVYALVVLGLGIFSPVWLTKPHFSAFSYLWLLWLASETMLHYHRTESLSLQIPETYIMYAFMLYSAGIVFMDSAKILVSAPEVFAYLHIIHGIIAVAKNSLLFWSFRLVWRQQQ